MGKVFKEKLSGNAIIYKNLLCRIAKLLSSSIIPTTLKKTRKSFCSKSRNESRASKNRKLSANLFWQVQGLRRRPNFYADNTRQRRLLCYVREASPENKSTRVIINERKSEQGQPLSIFGSSDSFSSVSVSSWSSSRQHGDRLASVERKLSQWRARLCQEKGLAKDPLVKPKVWDRSDERDSVDFPNGILSELLESFVEKFSHREHSEHRMRKWTAWICSPREHRFDDRRSKLGAILISGFSQAWKWRDSKWTGTGGPGTTRSFHWSSVSPIKSSARSFCSTQLWVRTGTSPFSSAISTIVLHLTSMWSASEATSSSLSAPPRTPAATPSLFH